MVKGKRKALFGSSASPPHKVIGAAVKGAAGKRSLPCQGKSRGRHKGKETVTRSGRQSNPDADRVLRDKMVEDGKDYHADRVNLRRQAAVAAENGCGFLARQADVGANTKAEAEQKAGAAAQRARFSGDPSASGGKRKPTAKQRSEAAAAAADAEFAEEQACREECRLTEDAARREVALLGLRDAVDAACPDPSAALETMCSLVSLVLNVANHGPAWVVLPALSSALNEPVNCAPRTPEELLALVHNKEVTPFYQSGDRSVFDDICRNFVGRSEVKEQLWRIWLEHRMDAFLKTQEGFDGNNKDLPHVVLKGPSGTGKTSVARILMEMWHFLNTGRRLDKNDVGGRLVEKNISELIGTCHGQSGEKTKAAIREAMSVAQQGDAVLFFDEVGGAIAKDDINKHGGRPCFHAYGEEVMSTIMQQMESSTGRLTIIFACYEDEWSQIALANVGLPGRMRHIMTMHPYSVAELAVIFMNMTEAAGRKLHEDVTPAFLEELIADSCSPDLREKRNARMCRSLLHKAILASVGRLAERSEWTLDKCITLCPCDLVDGMWAVQRSREDEGPGN